MNINLNTCNNQSESDLLNGQNIPHPYFSSLFKHLPSKDLLSFMKTCKLAYKIGQTSLQIEGLRASWLTILKCNRNFGITNELEQKMISFRGTLEEMTPLNFEWSEALGKQPAFFGLFTFPKGPESLVPHVKKCVIMIVNSCKALGQIDLTSENLKAIDSILFQKIIEMEAIGSLHIRIGDKTSLQSEDPSSSFQALQRLLEKKNLRVLGVQINRGSNTLEYLCNTAIQCESIEELNLLFGLPNFSRDDLETEDINSLVDLIKKSKSPFSKILIDCAYIPENIVKLVEACVSKARETGIKGSLSIRRIIMTEDVEMHQKQQQLIGKCRQLADPNILDLSMF